MFFFILKRAVTSFFILLAATVLMFLLAVNAGDPLADLIELQGAEREARIAQRTEALHLDQPVAARYLLWLQEVGRCVIPGGAECTLGLNRSGSPVLEQLQTAIGSTFRLVVVATLVAIVLGVAIGLVTALRQYSVFDYSITFVAFLLFSMPLFWLSTLLKQYLAIDLNNWLANPQMSYLGIAAVGLVAGAIGAVAIGGDRRRRLRVFAIAAVATSVTFYLLLITNWFKTPGLGPIGLFVTAFGLALGLTALLAGFRRRRILYAALATAAAGFAGYLITQPLMVDPSWTVIAGLAVLTLLISLGIGHVIGGPYARQARSLTAVIGLGIAFFVFVDALLGAYPSLSRKNGGRAIPTTGSSTPNLQGTFWETNLDYALYLVLPTIAIMLISFATYTRYTRASMLEVMNQDYVRTARAKGLSERSVVVKHAFRNAMIPITTLMAFDFAGVLGGAVITEAVFGWSGMGRMFTDGLHDVDPNVIMAFFLVTGVAAVAFNMLADIAYAFLDPRISLN
ncbi:MULTISPECIES: ABC transporter permease [unclassified Arthrobacter]|uniref:ABC transporter permease n=1 Tax=unclassified Arthrobacter TaxID=235627 RepID=UPI0024E021D3|nr:MULTISPECIES: ABC transporter permease [unclassified Arthrobacter]MCC9146506.1 ABC transporter permease [Arthrobacter sp. zg-Y919]MDK1277736.1 ABC transporter permease [Arthrobacter sp. zg.Y919]WIB02308.1 ABC transporter permease [Arthrobacter sp. zg-Y919]